MKNILYLYREIMPHHIPVLKELVQSGYNVTVVHVSLKKLTPYQIPFLENVNFLNKEEFTQKMLNKLAIELKPSVLFVCDRTNAIYNITALLLRKRFNTPVICGCDTQWRGGKQWANVFTAWFRHNRYYSHMLVAGMRQFEYAKKLGFENSKIIWPLYSADLNKFNKIEIDVKRFSGSKNILFVGRFAEVKGLNILLSAWSSIQDKKGTTLTLIGSGPLKGKLSYSSDVVVHEFMSQSELLEISSKASCFVLPSIFEPWALVIHEFAAAGLPMIVTSSCGATIHFVLNNYNGFVVESDNVEELKNALIRIIDSDANQLFEFGKRSRELSKSITPKMVAAALLSVVKE
ncbi:MAG TPA: glycosyltransferase family 4 protein [Prolixibacteraceae bacterium]|nr:glycosyltransferase family 4 protein [Prolixibacteraceae bacterium]